MTHMDAMALAEIDIDAAGISKKTRKELVDAATIRSTHIIHSSGSATSTTDEEWAANLTLSVDSI